MATFRLLNFGCRASQADGAALKMQLLNAGLAESGDARQSDFAVLNTCTVTATADAEVRQVIRRIHREDPQCRILVTGCYAQRAPDEIAALEGVAWVIGNSHKHQVPQILAGPLNYASITPRLRPSGQESISTTGSDRFPAATLAVNPQERVRVGNIAPQFHFLPVFPDDRTRPTLKVQDGCNARCSFCIIPAVRGPSRSLPARLVVTQARELEQHGYQEIVLSGINLGSYGRDLNPKITFLGLLETLLAETGIRRLRISSIEPMDVSPDLIRLVAREPRMADHFHVPLQSGCDRILRQMNRRYWTLQYAERVRAIREAIPHAGIGADVMAGFPGETDADHSASATFIESLPFTYLHVFPYSSRPSTPAAGRNDQVQGRIAHQRGAELRALIGRKRLQFLSTQIGRVLSALTLNKPRRGDTAALSSNFLDVALPGANLGPNQLLKVRVERLHEGRLYGRAEKAGCERHPDLDPARRPAEK